MKAHSVTLDAVHFNFDEVDERLLSSHSPEEDTEEETKLRAELEEGRASPEADILREMIRQVVIGRDSSKMSFDHIGKRFVALAWLLELDGVGGRSLADLANELGTSRAVLSYHVRTLNGVFDGMRCRGQKMNTTRASYRASAERSWREGKRSKLATRNEFDTTPGVYGSNSKPSNSQRIGARSCDPSSPAPPSSSPRATEAVRLDIELPTFPSGST